MLVALTMLAGVLGIFAFASVMQRRILFPAPPTTAPSPPPGSRVWGVAGPGGPVVTLYAPAPPGARTVVHFHGNGEQLADQVYLLRHLTGAGLGFCAVEYPGYGPMHDQRPSESALYAAADAALAG